MKKADIESMMEGRANHLNNIGLLASEVRGWSKNWSNLKAGAKRVGRVCALTFEEYTELASEAGIQLAGQVGRYPGAYQMGRNQDQGDYIKGNCRFITKEENLCERWLYDKKRNEE